MAETQKSNAPSSVAPVVEVEPLQPVQAMAPTQLAQAPIKALQAPTPSTVGGFKPDTVGSSYLARLQQRLGRNDLAVETIALDSAFTASGLEVKNQERVKAFVSGPTFPSGSSSGEGGNTLRPFVNAFFNADRLNSGEPVKTYLSAPVMRNIGNAWGDRLNVSNWDNLACTTTTMANIDPAGFAQVNHTGRMIADRNNDNQLFRGENRGGAVFGMNAGGPNAGAGFNSQDGADGGAAAQASLAVLTSNPQGIIPISAPSGAGDLAVPNAYGAGALRGLPM